MWKFSPMYNILLFPVMWPFRDIAQIKKHLLESKLYCLQVLLWYFGLTAILKIYKLYDKLVNAPEQSGRPKPNQITQWDPPNG